MTSLPKCFNSVDTPPHARINEPDGSTVGGMIEGEPVRRRRVEGEQRLACYRAA